MPTATVTQTSQKHKKEKDKERANSQPQQNERLKTVVRRLPPNLPEEVFWQSVQPWVTEETVVWKIFYPGKLKKKLNKENIPSRAYIAFKNEEQLALFSRGYDGHVFRDKAGVESQAVVEFAPYPKVPSEKRKPDTRNATIEKDEDYISFLESLKASENAEPVSLESLIAASQPPPPPKTTPLLEALKAEKSANKDKEAILRNHAHYTHITSRKDDKKKAVPNSLPAKPEAPFSAASDLASAGGKKGPKKGPLAQANPPPASAAKGPGSSAAPRNAPANQPSANQPPKPAKAPRPPRPPQVKATTNDAAARVNPPTPTLVAAPTDGTAAPAPPAAPRRTRPVLGLGSRQFEAALSGVSGLAGAASERKRREREKEKEGQAATPASGALSPGPTSSSFARIDAPETEKPQPPPSPKKDKPRRGGGGRGGAPGDGPQVKVPNILQRPEGPPPPVVGQKDASGPIANGTAAPPNSTANQPAASNTSGNAPRGGGRRGRGRGRGGVPSAAPRGG